MILPKWVVMMMLDSIGNSYDDDDKQNPNVLKNVLFSVYCQLWLYVAIVYELI